MSQVLMPKATAVWLVENTTLTFDQISAFTGLHPLEVQAIADGEVAGGMTGFDPTTNGQLTKEEIKRAEADKNARAEAHAARRADAGRALQGPALHAGRQAPGPSRRHRLAAQDPSRAAGQPGRQAGRLDQEHRPVGARPLALEHAERAAARSRDARPLHAEGPQRRRRQGAPQGRPRGRRQEEGAGQGRRRGRKRRRPP